MPKKSSLIAGGVAPEQTKKSVSFPSQGGVSGANTANRANRPVVNYVPAQLSEGKVWFIFFHAYDPATNTLRRKRMKIMHVKNSSTRRKYAAEMIDRINAALRDGWSPWESGMKDAVVSVRVAMEHFLKSRLRELEPDSARTYVSQVKILGDWLQMIGTPAITMHQFTRATAQAYMTYCLEEKRISERTHNNYVTFCRLMWAWFIENEYAAANPFERIRKLKTPEKNRETIPLEVRQRIIQYFEIHQPGMVMACMLLFYTELRPTEQTKILVGMVDMHRQIIRMDGETTKNSKSRFPTIPDVFKTYIDKNWNLAKARAGDYFLSDNFRSGPKKLNPRYISREWDVMRRALRLPMKYKFYSLRDSGIGHMLDAGISPVDVMGQSGHSDLSMTSVYMTKTAPKANDSIKRIADGF